jgi:V8-like Glu-specific endopeptidase
MVSLGIDITANKVKNFLLGKDIKETKTLLEVYKQHVEEVSALLGKEYAHGTLKRSDSQEQIPDSTSSAYTAILFYVQFATGCNRVISNRYIYSKA